MNWYQVRCPYCGKDIFIEYEDEVIKDGKLRGKCSRCGTFGTFDTSTKSFTETKRSDKLKTIK